MKKLFQIALGVCLTASLFAQDIPETKPNKKKDWSKVKLTGRANDHFMIQYGVAGWAQKPDSINTSGFSRSFNFYVMIDMPFKTDPRFSVAFGPGLGTDHIFFDKTNVTIADRLNPLRFRNVADTNHFKKTKLVTAYLEVPLELRFCMNPENSKKSFKAALGIKIGTLLDVHTKNKNWVDKNDKTISGFSDKFVQKQKDKYFFNGNRFVGTMRLGYGSMSLFGTYNLGTFVKEGLGPNVKPFSIGLTLSGL
jgi:hypothetical protein